jgi:heme/copper-type cytochrome/quinol oxidase subunit 2
MGHYRMRAMVRVVSEEAFEQWMKSQQSVANSRE